MKLSWNSLKISIAGAKLSHLVLKDQIWDHGSMTEQVKNVFYQVEKAKSRKDAEAVKKYVTTKAFEQLNQLIKKSEWQELILKNAVLTEVAIIGVSAATRKSGDRFTALIKGKRKISDDLIPVEIDNYGIENFSEKWFFTRVGDWWLLDRIR
jgi:hypothetical protein